MVLYVLIKMKTRIYATPAVKGLKYVARSWASLANLTKGALCLTRYASKARLW